MKLELQSNLAILGHHLESTCDNDWTNGLAGKYTENHRQAKRLDGRIASVSLHEGLGWKNADQHMGIYDIN